MLVEVDVDGGVVVEVDVVDEGVVVVVVAGEPGLTMLPNVVPVPAPPKMSESGLPEMSSIAVMKSSASTNTMPAAAAMAFQE